MRLGALVAYRVQARFSGLAVQCAAMSALTIIAAKLWAIIHCLGAAVAGRAACFGSGLAILAGAA